MIRTFAADHTFGLVHDPATGLTHHRPPLTKLQRRIGGQQRLALDDALLDREPVTSTKRLMPASLRWSPTTGGTAAPPADRVTAPAPATRRRIAGILSDTGVLGVNIAGGEPLLLPDLAALASTITAGGRTTVSVTTDGRHLQRRAAELARALDAVRVRLPLQHRPGPGYDELSLNAAIAGIRAAVRAGIPVQAEAALTTITRDGIQGLIDLAATAGATGLTVNPIPAAAAAVDSEAGDIADRLDVPAGFRLTLPAVDNAGSIVLNAEGRIWRNDRFTATLSPRPLRTPADLLLKAGTH